METKEVGKEKKTGTSKWKSYFWKIPFILILFFLFLVITSTLIITFNFSKSYLLKFALNYANEEFNGKFNFERVSFNPFKGIFLENLTMTLGNDTIAIVPKVRVDWEFLPIFKRKIYVDIVELENPRVRLTKELGDSLWNIERFFKPSTKTEAKSKTNLVVFLNNLKIKNAELRIFNKNINNKQNLFEPENLDIQNFFINLSGKLDLFTNKFVFDIRNLSFDEKLSNFTLKSLSAKISIDTTRINSEKIYLETGQSEIETSFNLSLEQTNEILFNFKKSNINTNDILKFVDIPLAKGKNINLSGVLKISDTLFFKEVSIDLERGSKLGLNGMLYKNGGGANIEIAIRYARISEEEVRTLIPTVFESVPVRFDFFLTQNFTFKFIDNTIHLQGDFSSSLGNADVELKIEDNLTMDFNIIFNKLNLAKIFNELPQTDLTGNVKGSLALENLSMLSGGIVCNIVDGKVNLNGLKNFRLFLNSNFDKGFIKVDTLELLGLRDDSSSKNAGSLHFSGTLDISNLKNPSYSGFVNVRDFLLAEFLPNEKNIPQKLSGYFEFKGKGLDINTLVLDFFGKFDDFFFYDRALLPFSIALKINHSDTLNRNITIESELVTAKIKGTYEISSILEDFSKQFATIKEVFENKLNYVFPSDTSFFEKEPSQIVQSNSSKNQHKFRKAKISAEFQIYDFSLLNIILNTDMNFSGQLNIDADIDENRSILKLDTLVIRNLSFSKENFRFSLTNLASEASYKVDLIDGNPVLDFIDFSATTDNRLTFGGSYFDYLDLFLLFESDSLYLESSLGFNSIFRAKLKSHTAFRDTLIVASFDELSIAFQNVFQWKLIEPFNIYVSSNVITVDNLGLNRENAEKINIAGSYYFSGKLDFVGKISKVPLIDFQKLFPEENSFSRIKSFYGIVEKVDFKVVNTLENPQLTMDLLASELKVENVDIGDINLNISYSNSNAFGLFELRNRNFSPMEIKLSKIPLELNFKDMKFGLLKDEEFEVTVNCDRFNLFLLNPLLSSIVENLQGSTKISTIISGFLPDDLKFYGFVDILESGFVARANNIKYFLNGKIELNGTEFVLQELKVKNTSEDYRNGNGIISGKIIFSNNRLESVDLSFKTPGIKVLSQASSQSLPQLFGDLIVSTSPGSLRFSYFRNEMLLEGNVNLVYGKLFMPGTSGGESVQQSFVSYEISGAKSIDTTQRKEEYKVEDKKSSNLKLDLTLKIIQPIELTLDLTSIGQVYALISLENNLSSLRFYSDPSNNITMLTGNDLVLREGSTLKFVRLFNTEGKINFPTGSIDNPGLNLVAKYSGQSIYNDAIRNYTVVIYITGTREKPNLRFDYTIDGQGATDDSSKVAQDAIFLLAFGKTKDEIEKGGLGSNFNLSEFSTSGSSALLSKIVSDALSGTGFISSADILLPPTASSLDRATLKMSGRFLGMTWNFGGTMADLLNNNELSIEIPIGNVLPFNLPNIILQLSRASNLTQSIQRNQKDWEIKLKYGSNW